VVPSSGSSATTYLPVHRAGSAFGSAAILQVSGVCGVCLHRDRMSASRREQRTYTVTIYTPEFLRSGEHSYDVVVLVSGLCQRVSSNLGGFFAHTLFLYYLRETSVSS
jgi:hypothetical protein